jgi:hypothetical protein
MADEERLKGQLAKPSRKTLRLTFRVSKGTVELVSLERLQMITPPQASERPEAGKHSGYWMELVDGSNRVLAHRLIDTSQLNSVEVHSPEGKIERKFGQVTGGIFEVLLPDMDGAKWVVLMGEPLIPPKRKAKRAEGSGELARFELPRRGKVRP